MKEKTIESLLVKLVRKCGLGKIIADVETLEHSYEGWKIVKELTSHSALKDI